jgi:ankyrin repeat protein
MFKIMSHFMKSNFFLQDQISRPTVDGYPQGLRPVMFAGFFYSERDNETSHVMMLKVLLHQILDRNSDFLHLFLNEFFEHHGKWTFHSLINIFLSLRQHPVPELVCVLIDAFDESDNHSLERETLVEALQDVCRMSGTCKIKVFLTSRPVYHLPTVYNLTPDPVYTFSLHMHTKSDITQYTRSSLGKLHASCQRRLAEQIAERAEGVFVWVKLVCHILSTLDKKGRNTEKELTHALETTPTDLAELYRQIMYRAHERCTPEEWDEQDSSHSKMLFNYILFADRALTVDELRHIFALTLFMKSADSTRFIDEGYLWDRRAMERRIIHCGKNLIEVRGYQNISQSATNPDASAESDASEISEDSLGARSVQLIHQTVRSYFLESVLEDFRVTELSTRQELAELGLRYLQLICFESNLIEMHEDWSDENCTALVVCYIGKWAWINYVLQFLPTILRQVNSDLITTLRSNLQTQLTAWRPVPLLLRHWASATGVLKEVHELSQGSDTHPPEVQGSGTAEDFKNILLKAASVHGQVCAAGFLLQCGADLESEVDNTQKTPLLWAAQAGHESAVRFLLERGARPMSADCKKNTAVHLAALHGHELVVQLLVDQIHIEPNSWNAHGQTPLYLAAEHGHIGVVHQLVERAGVNVSQCFAEIRTPLSIAVEGGHLDVVRFLADQKDVDPNLMDYSGCTPLSLAARWGHIDIVKFLVERADVDADYVDGTGQTPLSVAARCGHLAVVKLLVERAGVDVNSVNSTGQTPLSVAALRGQLDVVRFLVERVEVSADCVDGTGQTPLLVAALWGHLEVVRFLADRAGVDAGSTGGSGRAPLLVAARYGHLDVVKFLAERADVDVDSVDGTGQTALSVATQCGHLDIVRFLVERADVDVNSVDGTGQTALSVAARWGHIDVVKFLVERADVDADFTSGGGWTPLSLAARWGHLEVVRFLVETADVDADSVDGTGQTPLSVAARWGHIDVVRILAEREDVDVNSVDDDGWTPLSLAARYGHLRVVRFLVEMADVDVDCVDDSGQTPLSLAEEMGHLDVVRFLAEWEARVAT